MDVSFVFPCLDEAPTLAGCIRAVRESFAADPALVYEVVVADNGSSDGSPEIATREGARVVPVATRGYGAAVQGGIAAASGTHVLFADSDGTYHYEQSLDLYRAAVAAGAALAIAARTRALTEPGAIPWIHRTVGTPALTFLINCRYGTAVTDCNSGFRCVDRGAWSEWNLASRGMEYASEMIVRAAVCADHITEIPTGLRCHPEGRRSKLRPLRDGARHLAEILRHPAR